jgi:peptidoglycan/LPS O-acetylase OafA/YrhL
MRWCCAIGRRALGALALVSGAGLAASGLALGSLDQGSYWETLWMAPVRLCFPFVTGLWLYRVRDRLPQVRLGWPLLSAIMVAAMLLPIWPVVGGSSSMACMKRPASSCCSRR